MLEAIETIRKTGSEKFLNGNTSTLMDYWAWAHSDILGNTERGKIAEYIVAMALDTHRGTRTEWDSYDIRTEEGIKIEVKSSAYLQTWAQKTYSRIDFGIQPTQIDNTYNTNDQTRKRRADVYVFCVITCKEQDSVNPLDLDQWDFYVLSTNKLNDKIPDQKKICLAGIQELGARKTNYSGLYQAIHSEFVAV